MFSRFVAVLTAAALALLAPAALRGQAGAASPAGMGLSSGRVTLGGALGGLSGAANLNPAGTTDWRLGWIGSVDGTVWLERHMGIRASGSWAQDSISNAALTGAGQVQQVHLRRRPGAALSRAGRLRVAVPLRGGRRRRDQRASARRQRHLVQVRRQLRRGTRVPLRARRPPGGGRRFRLQVRSLRVRQDPARHRLAGRRHAVLLTGRSRTTLPGRRSFGAGQLVFLNRHVAVAGTGPLRGSISHPGGAAPPKWGTPASLDGLAGTLEIDRSLVNYRPSRHHPFRRV